MTTDILNGTPLNGTPFNGNSYHAAPEPHVIANHVVLIGTLDPMPDYSNRQGAGVAKTNSRTALNGAATRFRLALINSLSEPYTLVLETNKTAEGQDLLVADNLHKVIAVEGQLRLNRAYDPRIVDANDPFEPGKERRELEIVVRSVRFPHESEPQQGGSFTQLYGTVQEPARIIRHPDLPSMELAIVNVLTRVSRPSAFQNSRAIMNDDLEVEVAIPTSHPNAIYLYRAGNIISVEGELDCRLEPQFGRDVNEVVKSVTDEYKTRLDHVQNKENAASREGQNEVRQVTRLGRNEVQRLTHQQHPFVMAGFIELIEGTEQTRADAYEARRNFDRKRREERQERQQRREQREQQASDTGAPPVVEPVRRRRRNELNEVTQESVAAPLHEETPVQATASPLADQQASHQFEEVAPSFTQFVPADAVSPSETA